MTYTGLGAGSHTFSVRAVDPLTVEFVTHEPEPMFPRRMAIVSMVSFSYLALAVQRLLRRAIRARQFNVNNGNDVVNVLNEATDYLPTPSAFSRGLRVPLGNGTALLLLSGTASVDEKGDTVHAGDFRAQCWRTFRNLARLLESEGATWHDVVRTTCYLRDIERDYRDFNEVRNWFFRALALDPVPASTGIQARICRSDLLVEIEAMAVVPDAAE